MDHKEVSESEHYHSIEKGCKIRGLLKESKEVSLGMGKYCETHKKYICRCGWEWYHHYEEIKRKKIAREKFDSSYTQTWDKKSKRYKVKHIDL